MDGCFTLPANMEGNRASHANASSSHSLADKTDLFLQNATGNNATMDFDDLIHTFDEQDMSMASFTSPKGPSVKDYLALEDNGSRGMYMQYQTPCDLFEAEFLTPLISPALTPSLTCQAPSRGTPLHQPASTASEITFSPLSSPAILPQGHVPHFSSQSLLSDNNANGQAYGQIPQNDLCERYAQLEEAKQEIAKQLAELQRKEGAGDLSQAPSFNSFPPQQQRTDLLPGVTGSSQSKPSTACVRPVSMSFASVSPISPGPSPSIEPVTPASLMKIKRTWQSAEASLQATMSNTSSPLASSVEQPPSKDRTRESHAMVGSASEPSAETMSKTTGNSVQRNPGKRARRDTCHSDAKSVVASPRALKPLLVSPVIKPDLQHSPLAARSIQDAEHILATRSNYQNLMEGKGDALGIAFSSSIKSGLQVRRSAHKAAEQKRRDSLREWIERLRREVEEGYINKKGVVPKTSDGENDDTSAHDAATPSTQPRTNSEKEQASEDDPSSPRPLPRAVLLKYTYDYILHLKQALAERDAHIKQLESQHEAPDKTPPES